MSNSKDNGVIRKPQKDILFLCQFFYPDHNSSATLPFDTAKYLASHGYTVDALVGYPKEYSSLKDIPLEEKAEGVSIMRLKYMQLNRVGKISRLINYFSFTLHALLKTSLLKNYKAVIVYSNPPILPIVPILAKRKHGTKIIFVAYDVYPEVAYASQTLYPDSLISRVMNRLNKALYRSVDCVVALTDEMKEFLLTNRPELSSDRVVVIANWAHETGRKPDYEAYNRFGYQDGQFIVSYFGNMGTCQDVDTMMQAAELLKDDVRVRFLLVGHGNKKSSVETRINERELRNVQLLDFITGKDFQQAVSISSCCIVSLEKGLKGTCAPSKYYSYLQGGQPIIAVVEKDSYLAKEVEQEQIGYAVEIGNGTELQEVILNLLNNPQKCKEMGERGKNLYQERYAYEVAMKKYDQMIQKTLWSRNEIV